MIKITLSIVIMLVTMLVVMFLTLGTMQESLIYRGMKRTKHELKEPFTKVNNSYYKKGETGKLWVMLGGNGTLPVDFKDYVVDKKDSFLLITYPGYNGTENKPNPETMNETIENDINQLNKEYKINFLCYSIGCAVAINYLSTKGKERVIDKVILLAPFWSIDEIMYDNYYFPRTITKNILNHNWENENIKNISPEVDVTIIHGKNDELINYEHAIKLSKLRKTKLILTDDDHDSIFYKIPDLI